jgi:hypothetical protein
LEARELRPKAIRPKAKMIKEKGLGPSKKRAQHFYIIKMGGMITQPKGCGYECVEILKGEI